MPMIDCPTCRKSITYADLTEVPWRPFCCRRCKLIDLGRWLNEEYRVSEEIREPSHSRDLPADED